MSSGTRISTGRVVKFNFRDATSISSTKPRATWGSVAFTSNANPLPALERRPPTELFVLAFRTFEKSPDCVLVFGHARLLIRITPAITGRSEQRELRSGAQRSYEARSCGHSRRFPSTPSIAFSRIPARLSRAVTS